jgi:hypothetical protein
MAPEQRNYVISLGFKSIVGASPESSKRRGSDDFEPAILHSADATPQRDQ